MPMRLFYKLPKSLILFSLLFVFVNKTNSQTCPGGQLITGLNYDSTVSLAAGVTNATIKFPKFNPANGMVSYMRLCLTMTGVVDSLSFENNQAVGENYSANYTRFDELTGSGLGSALYNNVNKGYSFSLQPSDGVPGSGLDYGAVSKDTVLKEITVCRDIIDSDLFYGSDSLIYNYFINAGITIPSGGSSGNANITVATSGSVRISMEFVYCPPITLPTSIGWFTATKTNETEAAIKWQSTGSRDNLHYYEAEWSTDGINYTSITKLTQAESDDNGIYTTSFLSNNAKGKTTYYFRIKQVSTSGKVSYSQVRQLTMGNSDFAKFSVFPNPSNGIVGIKFVNSISGQYLIQIFNTQGQLITHKNVSISNSSHVVLNDLQLKSGMYVVKTTETRTGEAGVSQLIIK